MAKSRDAGQKAVMALSKEELRTVLDAITDTPTGRRNRAMVLLMADAGLRVGEVLAVQPGDVVTEANQVTHVIVREGKGGKVARQKLTGRASLALAIWLEERKGLGLPADGPVFCTISRGQATGYAEGQELQPGRVLSSAYVRQLVKRLGKRAGLGDRLHPHLLRHTAITSYLRANRDLELTRKFARHSDVRTTAAIYAHLVQEDVDAGVARMEAEAGDDPGAGLVADLAAVLGTLTPEQKAALVARLGGDA